MRILNLNDATARRFLERRRASDPAALATAARIVRDVERRGDRALFAWSKRLDKLNIGPRTLWISRKEIAAARRDVSPELLRALEHAARNIRRVAERQLPRDWSFVVEPGVRVGQRVTPLDAIGCYVPGTALAGFNFADVSGARTSCGSAADYCGVSKAERGGAGGGEYFGIDGDRAHRRRASDRRVRVRNAIGAARR